MVRKLTALNCAKVSWDVERLGEVLVPLAQYVLGLELQELDAMRSALLREAGRGSKAPVADGRGPPAAP